ncbi:hypothetical protein [Salibacterium sp. K-3]
MGKNSLLYMSLLVMIVGGTACSSEDPAATESSDQTETVEDVTEKEEAEKQEEGSTKEEKGMENQGDPRVDINGEIVFSRDNDAVQIEGTTNLMPGAELSVSFDAVKTILFANSTDLTVEEDGSFSGEVDYPNLDEPLDLMITFSPDDQKEDIIEAYGEYGENLEGPFVRIDPDEERENGEPKHILYTDYVLGEEDQTITIEPPGNEPPEDYGETEAWLDFDAERKGDFVYIEGQSNILQGARILASIDADNYIISGYNDDDDVRPDGSFRMRAPIPGEDNLGEDADPYVKVAMRAYEQPPYIQEVYGETGGNLQGSMVKETSTDRYRVVKQVKISELASSE